MKLDFVEIAGFRGFKERTTFVFDSGFAVLSGRNGVGKSSVFDAIDFAITGSINKYRVKGAKGGGLESHIWWVGEGIPREQYVEVGFLDAGGSKFTVRRSRERGLETPHEQLATRLCTTPVSSPDWASTLMQTSLIRDETIASLSLDLTEQERFSAVQAAMGGIREADYSERTREIVRAAEGSVNLQEQKVNGLLGDLGRALSSLTEAQSVAANSSEITDAEQIVKSVLNQDLKLNGEGIRELRRIIVERRQSLGPLEIAAADFEKIQSRFEYLTSSAGRAELEQRLRLRDALTSERDSALRLAEAAERQYKAEREHDSLIFHLSSLMDHGHAVGLLEGHCPLCNAPRNQTEFDEALDSLRRRLADRGHIAQQLSAAVDEAQSALHDIGQRLTKASDDFADLSSQQERIMGEREALRATLEQLGVDPSISDAMALRQAILRRREELASLEQAFVMAQTSAVTERLNTAQVRVANLRKSADIERAKLDASQRALEAAKQIDKANKVVANELLTEQFETVLPLLKELYLRLRPHSEWREIETDIAGHIRASLNFTVGDGKNPQFLFSSGQRRTAGIAFLLAIHLSRPWCAFNTLLLDDPIQHIDDYRALNLVEVLGSIRRTGRQVIVAVEDDALADVMCRRLRSGIAERGKRFELSTGLDGSARISSEISVHPLPASVMQLAEAS